MHAVRVSCRTVSLPCNGRYDWLTTLEVLALRICLHLDWMRTVIIHLHGWALLLKLHSTSWTICVSLRRGRRLHAAVLSDPNTAGARQTAFALLLRSPAVRTLSVYREHCKNRSTDGDWNAVHVQRS